MKSIVPNRILRSIYRQLPPEGKAVSRSAYAALRFTYVGMKSVYNIPLKRRLFGDKADLVPPLYLMEDGNPDYTEFKQNGAWAFDRFAACGLKPSDRVLDVGSGIGRKTLPLLEFLTTGSYEGIDPIEKQVAWCSERITSRYPRFRFRRVDLWSKHYNPKGTIRPSEYLFPFGDSEFDFVILGSIFTHMFTEDVLHYISELSRLLRPGGKGFVTFFLLNAESEALISGHRSSQNLVYELENGSRADNTNRLETAVGHQESFVAEAFQSHGIKMEVTDYGSWCGRTAQCYQDVARLTRLPNV